MYRPRAEQIEANANSAVDRWLTREIPFQPARYTPSGEGVLHAMPRRKAIPGIEMANVALPMARYTSFNPSPTRVISRLFVWLFAVMRVLAGNALDRVLGRSTIARRAERLRRAFERMGASFTKIAQQLSLRADLLPYEYCIELGKLLDRADPFPTEQAIKIIESSIGRPLSDIFAVFDPKPIGSASIACVFQAMLKSGQRVAVKVRRPQVGIILIADIRALDWLLWLGEVLTIVRPGTTRRLSKDLEKILNVELNFRNEARYTDIFRTKSEEAGGDVTAPRIFFEYCSERVMVSEFVSGVWMWEIMSAVDANNTDFLAKLRKQGIRPKELAHKLIRTAHRELLEDLFYHADPHPANIVVGPDNRLCFIDFGSVGRLSRRTRSAWRELHFHMRSGDVERMIQCTLNLMGPLPPVDIERIVSSLETIYASWVFAMNSSDAEWWERSTAQAMLNFFAVARDNGLPATTETILFLRATLIYDTIIARLDPHINVAEEWRQYEARAGRDARKRFQKTIRKRLAGPLGTDYLQMEQISQTATQQLFNWQRQVEQPVVFYKSVVGKIAYAAMLLLRLAGLVILIGSLGVLAQYAASVYYDRPISLSNIIETVVVSKWLQIAILLTVVLVIRRLLLRLNQPDSKPDAER